MTEWWSPPDGVDWPAWSRAVHEVSALTGDTLSLPAQRELEGAEVPTLDERRLRLLYRQRALIEFYILNT